MQSKIDKSIEIIRLAAKMSRQYYDKPLIITYSGGKDSDVLVDLSVKSRADVEFFNSHTTVDAPETVYHIREKFKQLEEMGYKTTIHKPETSMWKLIEKKGVPPTRIFRYCCQELKESSTQNRFVATGVRGDESRQRATQNIFNVRGATKKRGLHYSLDHVEEVYKEAQEMDEVWDCKFITVAKEHKNLIANPIFDWTSADIWTYIHSKNIKYNPLYERGYQRVGCIGCPLVAGKRRYREFADYPQYQKLYLHAFDRMCKRRKAKGMKKLWETGQEAFDWWMQDDTIPGQMSIEDYLQSKG